MTSQLVEAWTMNNEANLFLLGEIRDAWLADRYAPRTRTVGGQFAHMHGVRLRWLHHSAPESAGGLEPFARGVEPGRSELRKALQASDKVVADYLAACDAAGKVKSWQGPPATFLGYLVAHEAHHRGLVMVALRAGGRKVDQKVIYGLWDWGKKRSSR